MSLHTESLHTESRPAGSSRIIKESFLAGSDYADPRRTNAPRTVTECGTQSGGEAGEYQREYYRELHLLQKSVEDIVSLALEVQHRLAPVTGRDYLPEEQVLEKLEDPCSLVTANMRELHVKLNGASKTITNCLTTLVI